MKTKLLALPILAGCLGLGGCYVAETATSPYYGRNVVYTTGYYGYRPNYWNVSYLPNYGWWGGPRWRTNYVTYVPRWRHNYVVYRNYPYAGFGRGMYYRDGYRYYRYRR